MSTSTSSIRSVGMLERVLDRLHARVVAWAPLRYFTACTRLLLAIGFAVPALPKLAGVPFTNLPTTTPVGAFFAGFFAAPGYYAFVGVMQLLAALLLLVPRSATLGAVLYAPIIANILLVTLTLDFAGTSTIAALMALANLYLLAWDWPRLKGLLPLRAPRRVHRLHRDYAVAAAMFGALGAIAYSVIALTGLGLVYEQFGSTGFVPAVGAGAGFGAAVAWHARRMGSLPRLRSPHGRPTGHDGSRVGG